MNRYLTARSGLITALLLAGLAALAFAVPTLFAVSFSLGDDLEGGGPGGSLWETGNDDYACNTDLSGNTINDAELDPDDETPILNQDDAFDDALQLIIDGAAFDDADDTGDLVTDATGQALTLGPEEMSVGEAETLNVTLEYKALSSEAKLRTFVTLENATEADIPAPIVWDSALGSDEDTTIAGTSSGDTIFAANDRWLVTFEAFEDTAPSDPVNTFVLFGPGSPDVTPSGASLHDDDCVTVDYDITVPAGETRYLLFFNQLSQTNEDALADAPVQFDANPASDSDLVSGLDPAALPAVLNWDFAPAPTPTPSPTATPAPTATATPTPTQQAPAALPPTGAQPGSSGLAWLAFAIGGIAALAGGAVLTRRFARSRR
jgi:hypothetical protein